MKAIKSIKGSVDDSLTKLRSKKWSKPLGKTLNITGQICDQIGKVVPGVGIIGGALSLGSTLLNPEPSLGDLQKSLNEIKNELKSISEPDAELRAILEEGVLEEIRELERKIALPMSEIRSDLTLIHGEMSEVKKVLQEASNMIAEELSEIKDLIKQTFAIVTDVKYKVCLCYNILKSNFIIYSKEET